MSKNNRQICLCSDRKGIQSRHQSKLITGIGNYMETAPNHKHLRSNYFMFYNKRVFLPTNLISLLEIYLVIKVHPASIVYLL